MVTLGEPDRRISSLQHRSKKSDRQTQSKIQKLQVAESIALLTRLVELDCGHRLFGIRIWSCSSTFENNVISGNHAGWGGGMAIDASAPVLDTNDITNNSTIYTSGGVSLYD